CRARHIKCDERKPTCRHCERKNLPCKQTDIIVPCNWDEPPAPPQTSNNTAATPSDDPAPASTWEVIQQSQSTIPQSHPPAPPLTTWPSPSPVPPNLYITDESASLLRIYQHGVGPWMDVLDHTQRYQRDVLRLALASPLILHALCALAAKQMSRADASAPPSLWEPLAARYYGESLRLLIRALAEDTSAAATEAEGAGVGGAGGEGGGGTGRTRKREETLTATILLASCELLAAPSADYARHLRGALTLMQTGGIDFRSASRLEAAGLWVFARQDVAMAVAGKRGLLWGVGRWGCDWSGAGDAEEEEDWWGRKLLWLLARAVECVFVDADGSGLASRVEPVEGLLAELEEWRGALPRSFEGLRLKGGLAEGLDEMWFPIDSAGMVHAFV
ncbi:hypothetical protein BK809_0003961, partial [Diplodia seriata]